VIEQEEQPGVERETIASEYIQFHTILMGAINSVRMGIVNDYDAGIMALLSLFALLPSKVRKEFNADYQHLSKVVNSDVYSETGTYRITRSVRAQYAVGISECLSRIVDELDKAGMLWKSRNEMVGGEL